jgi:hypothetical protein
MGTAGILAATGSVANDAEVAALLVFYGLLGYGYAIWTRRSIGTTPWRLPAIAWAVLSAMLPLFGLMLEMIARLTTRQIGSGGFSRLPLTGPPGRRSGYPANNFGSGPPSTGAVGNPARPGEAEPNVTPWGTAWRANPAGGTIPWPETVATRPGPGGWRPPAPGDLAQSATPPLFGWYPDPDGVHEERYWDGRLWSDHVRDGGELSIDPLPEWKAPTPWGQPEAGAGADTEAP